MADALTENDADILIDDPTFKDSAPAKKPPAPKPKPKPVPKPAAKPAPKTPFRSAVPKFARLLAKYRTRFIAASGKEYDTMAKALIAWIKGFETRKKVLMSIKNPKVKTVYKKDEFGPANKKATDDFFKKHKHAFCAFFMYAKTDPQVPIKPSRAAVVRCGWGPKPAPKKPDAGKKPAPKPNKPAPPKL